MNQEWLSGLVEYLSSNWATWDGFNLSWSPEHNEVNVHMEKSWSHDTICGYFYFDDNKNQYEFDPQSRSIFDANATNLFTVFFILQSLDMHKAGNIEGHKTVKFPL